MVENLKQELAANQIQMTDKIKNEIQSTQIKYC